MDDLIIADICIAYYVILKKFKTVHVFSFVSPTNCLVTIAISNSTKKCITIMCVMLNELRCIYELPSIMCGFCIANNCK